jgi:prepilin-type N-terminal cleavage/methylation domain-containing protein
MKASRRGHTLIEILVVIVIMAVIFTALANMTGSSNFTNGCYNALGVVQKAQSYAMAHSTYVWVGFFEENPSTPGVAGQGQLVISSVASVDGTNLLSQLNGTSLPNSSLTQLSQIVKIPNIHVSTTLTAANIPNLQPANYEIDPTTSSSGGAVTFVYPLQGNTPQYTFQQIVQFNPQGEASVIYGNPVGVMQLGLIPAPGNIPAVNSKNVSAIQILGISGSASIYRP